MTNYNVSVDLSSLFDDLSERDQREFIVENFGSLIASSQECVINEIIDSLSGSITTSLIKDAFDSLNYNAQADVADYVKGVMGED